MKTVVLIPCYNEALTISKVINDFKRELPHAEIIVYDNNSTDDSVNISKNAGAKVNFEYKQGKGNVVKAMFRDINADCYIMVDADDTYSIDKVKEMEKLILDKKADIVVGDRLSSTYFRENKRRFHNIGNKLVRKSINTFFKSDLKDIMSGFRAFSYDFVKAFPISSKEFEIETEMTIFALSNNFKVMEVPINYKDRIEGSHSKLNTYHDGYKVIKTIFSLILEERPLFFFSLVTFILLIIACLFFVPVLIKYFNTGFVDKIPTLIMVVMVVIVAIILFLTGVVLDILRKQSIKEVEHHIKVMRQFKSKGEDG